MSEAARNVAWAASASDEQIYQRLALTVTSASGTMEPKRLAALGRAWFKEREAAFRQAACPTIMLLLGDDSDVLTAIAVVAGLLVGVAHEELMAALYASALLIRKALDGYCDGVR